MNVVCFGVCVCSTDFLLDISNYATTCASAVISFGEKSKKKEKKEEDPST